jgi:magnesium chelatase subunit D
MAGRETALPEDAVGRARLALALLAIDPKLGGLALRARCGPVRDAVMAQVAGLPLPCRKLHPAMTDDALFGGIDLTATLAEGRVVESRGILAEPATLVLTMAERCGAGMAARLARAMDEGAGHVLILLDEGAGPEEAAPVGLTERLAFAVELDGARAGAVAAVPEAASVRLSEVRARAEDAEVLAVLCARLGIWSARAPLFALRAARAHAALAGRQVVTDADIEVAAALVLAHRATQMPESGEEQEPPPPPEDGAEREEQEMLDLPEELLLEAVKALIPADFLARLDGARRRAAKGSGSGARTKGNRRGRPLPSRAGRAGTGARVDLVATLRCAAPWQPLRRKAAPERTGVLIHTSDIRLKRFEDRSDRLIIFAVDASGSSAVARLAEAKGAVELLLAQAYARRDHVALVAFRGEGAEVLLPPTRSLVQTKRRLAGLPGGGGTPLAAGLQQAMEVADQAARRGLTPTLALLTDGRANIALDGRPDRAAAGADAERMARACAAAGIESIVIDTGNRPERALAALAALLGGTYLPLPRADAERMSAAVASALGD